VSAIVGRMTADDFRRLALGMPEASEVGHMGHPDFRVGGKIFATLGYPDEKWGTLKLTPEQQEAVVAAEPRVFVPVKGGWGRRGATGVSLREARTGSLRVALGVAWRNVAPAKLAALHSKDETAKSPRPAKRVTPRKTTTKTRP
jgi:hypothetical protein